MNPHKSLLPLSSSMSPHTGPSPHPTPASATRLPECDRVDPLSFSPSLDGFQAGVQQTWKGGAPQLARHFLNPFRPHLAPTLQDPFPPWLWSLWEPDSWGCPAGLASSQAPGDLLREEGAAEPEARVAACPGSASAGAGLPA